jgi:hypothetical protein
MEEKNYAETMDLDGKPDDLIAPYADNGGVSHDFRPFNKKSPTC